MSLQVFAVVLAVAAVVLTFATYPARRRQCVEARQRREEAQAATFDRALKDERLAEDRLYWAEIRREQAIKEGSDNE